MKNNKKKKKIEEDNHIIKSHNKTLLLYHIVFPVKYRKKLLTEDVESTIKEVCERIEIGYEIQFIEIGLDLDYIHFLIQGIPNMSITQIITVMKSITSREIFKLHPTIKKYLYGGNFWTSGYYANTVG
jgi:REP element-mobilizing transposase RayT